MWENLKREVLKPCSGSPTFGRNDWRQNWHSIVCHWLCLLFWVCYEQLCSQNGGYASPEIDESCEEKTPEEEVIIETGPGGRRR